MVFLLVLTLRGVEILCCCLLHVRSVCCVLRVLCCCRVGVVLCVVFSLYSYCDVCQCVGVVLCVVCCVVAV